jgi:rRNA-processing protein FCF1
MVISRVLGGFGNQLFQYAIAKAIAQKNKVTYKLDIEHFENYNLFKYRLDLLQINENIASHKEIVKYHGDQSFKSKILRRTISPYFYREKRRYIYDPIVFDKNRIYLDGYWQNKDYFDDIAIELKQEFKLREIPENIKSKLEEIKTTNSVSIHVRRGDYKQHTDFYMLDLEYYMKAVSKIKDSNVKYYIFTNDKKWCNEKFNFLNNYEVVTCSKNEVEDFYLMSQCKHNIIANSTFSWWAAWLNENNSKVIIAPKKWKLNQDTNWLPQDWIKI